MSSDPAHVLSFAATLYGVGAAAMALLQARAMLRSRDSCGISARFLGAYVGGYALWLVYGVSIGSVPLIVTDAIGLVCGGTALAVALALRGSLWRPSTWTCSGHAGRPPGAAAPAR